MSNNSWHNTVRVMLMLAAAFFSGCGSEDESASGGNEIVLADEWLPEDPPAGEWFSTDDEWWIDCSLDNAEAVATLTLYGDQEVILSEPFYFCRYVDSLDAGETTVAITVRRTSAELSCEAFSVMVLGQEERCQQFLVVGRTISVKMWEDTEVALDDHLKVVVECELLEDE